MVVSARWASGARSPLAPTDPFSGITGVTPRFNISTSVSTTIGATAAVPERQDIRAQQQHRARFFNRQGIAQAARMTAHQIQLQLANLRRVDANVGQLSKARVDAIDRAIFGDDSLDDAAGLFNSLACFGGERHVFFSRARPPTLRASDSLWPSSSIILVSSKQ